jgi:hypothetical protein
MSALTVNLPDNLHEKARQVAASKNLSMDAFVAMALSQSLSRLVADPYLEERASRATGKGIDEFMKQVPATDSPEWDRLPEGYSGKSKPQTSGSLVTPPHPRFGKGAVGVCGRFRLHTRLQFGA